MEIRFLRGTHAPLTKLQLFEERCNVESSVLRRTSTCRILSTRQACTLHLCHMWKALKAVAPRDGPRQKHGRQETREEEGKETPSRRLEVWAQRRKNVRNQTARANLPRALECGLWNTTSATQSCVCARRIHSEIHSPSSIPRRARCPKAQSASPMSPTRWDLLVTMFRSPYRGPVQLLQVV